MKNSKKRCCARGFSDTIKKGKRGKKQGYKCKSCGISFTSSIPGRVKSNR